MILSFYLDGELMVLHAEPDGECWRIRLPDGSEHRITARRTPDDVVQVVDWRPTTNDQRPTIGPDESSPQEQPVRVFRVPFARTERGIELSYDGGTFVFGPTEARPAGGAKRRTSGSLTAPMPGVVAEVLVKEGQTVDAYQPLVVMEAMKVMATIEAPFAGTVAKVHVQKRQQVRHGEALVEITRTQE